MAAANDSHDLELIATLVADLHEGSISDSDMARLNGLLLNDRDGRLMYLQQAQLEAGLHWIYAARKQVASVIDDRTSAAARPVADVAQQQLRFADDARFVQVAAACAANESHLQDWLQIYPRILAVTTLCSWPTAGRVEPVQAIVDKLLPRYSSQLSRNAFWQAAHQSAREALAPSGRTRADIADLVGSLCECAFELPAPGSLLDVFAIHEILDEWVPHRVPADALRVLCLRYLNGLPPRRIALHLQRPVQQVQALLAKMRVHLLGKYLVVTGTDVGPVNVGDLLRWSFHLDGSNSSATSGAAPRIPTGLGATSPLQLLLLAMVDDYLSRQLSTARLLEELPSHRNRSYLLAVEQSLRDIETLGTRYSAPAKSLSAEHGISKRALHVAALLGLAAGLLIAVGLGMFARESQLADAVPSVSPPKVSRPEATSPPVPIQPPAVEAESEPAPPPPPVVAVVSAAIDVPAKDRDRLHEGAPLRMNDVVSFQQGILQLTTTAGSQLVLEGPIDASMVDINRVALRRGKIAGRNEIEGQTLIIDSPKSSVVDVGTEFGVGVGENDDTIVSVFDGEVRLESVESSPEQTPSEILSLQAGWETKVGGSESAVIEATPLPHDRGFIRSDEVQMRKDAADGNVNSAAKVALFELMRVKGLIGYQAFHGQSTEDGYSLGFRTPSVRHYGDLKYAADLSPAPSRFGQSSSLSMGKDAICYLDLDTGNRSRLALAGLVDESGMIGNRPGELWLSWRAKMSGPPTATFSWGGLSLMFGDKRAEHEPLFLGQPAQMSQFGVHAYPGRGAPWEFLGPLGGDAGPGGAKRYPLDFEEHLWLVRLTMDGAATEVAVWCDVEPSDAATTEPAAKQVIGDFRFDRIRLEAHPEQGDGQWLFDDVIVAMSSEAVAEAHQVVMKGPNQPDARTAE